jgi:hypothetical protein
VKPTISRSIKPSNGSFFTISKTSKKQALSYYISLDKATDDDEYLVASNYRNRNMYFKNASIPLQLNIMTVH